MISSTERSSADKSCCLTANSVVVKQELGDTHGHWSYTVQ